MEVLAASLTAASLWLLVMYCVDRYGLEARQRAGRLLLRLRPPLKRSWRLFVVAALEVGCLVTVMWLANWKPNGYEALAAFSLVLSVLVAGISPALGRCEVREQGLLARSPFGMVVMSWAELQYCQWKTNGRALVIEIVGQDGSCIAFFVSAAQRDQATAALARFAEVRDEEGRPLVAKMQGPERAPNEVARSRDDGACATACPGTALDPTLLADHGTASRLGQAVSFGNANPDSQSSQAVAHPWSAPGTVQAHLNPAGEAETRGGEELGRFQFNLGAMLLALLLASTACAWFAAYYHRPDPIGRVLDRLSPYQPKAWRVSKELSIEERVFDLDFSASPIKPGDDALAELDQLPGLAMLNLSGAPITDAGLVHIARLDSLEYLDLSKTAITDAGIAHLEGLTTLRSLTLDGTQLTDAGVPHLAKLTALQSLHLHGARITDASIPHLAKLKGLRDLRAFNTGLSRSGIKRLQEELPTTRVFCFNLDNR